MSELRRVRGFVGRLLVFSVASIALAADTLPRPDTAFKGKIDRDRNNSAPYWPQRAGVIKGAPNIVLILLDDVGFGAASTYGGPVATPGLDRLAASGLRYNRFHVNSLCSPTRAALLSGRNDHEIGFGTVVDGASGFPGYNSVWPKSAVSVAEVLRQNGYSTAAFGKWHNTPVWETSPAGPFDHWPTSLGFEYYYGFMGGDDSQWYPRLYRNTQAVEPPTAPAAGYHLTTDLVNDAIHWVRQHDAVAPQKPFFLYFATGATHEPHHVPKVWIEKYKGKFDQGWDKLREQIFSRQKEIGVIPSDAELTKRPEDIPAWEQMPKELQPILARQMEIYAAFLEHTDHHVGRLVDALKDLEILGETLVMYIIGDNGASAEGTLNGSFNEMAMLNGMSSVETVEFMKSKIDEFGGPHAYNHYAVGWAHAMDTPYQWTKQVASHFGGTRNGTIVHWPNGIKAKGEIRSQFHHVIDVAPTILEAAGLRAPEIVNSVQQAPLEGFSMLYAFDNAKAPERHETQYFEMFCNRGIYHKGWTAVTRHSTPWDTSKPLPAFDDDVWELYDTNKDWTQARNVAKDNPQKLRELQRLWLIEATKYSVLPLDDRRVERFNPDLAGRPQLVKGKTQILFGGMGRLSENSVINIKNKSYSVTAEVVVPKSGAKGVIIAQGGAFNGWSLYAKDGKLKYCYNLLGIKLFYAETSKAIPSGQHQVRMEFKYDGGGLAKGGTSSLYLDGTKIGEGRVEITVPMAFSADETCDVGKGTGSAVSPDYDPRDNEFSGEVNWVQIDLEKDDHDHLISPGERFKVAMARQ